MKNLIAMVDLDLGLRDKEFKPYTKLSVDQKIALFSERIKAICEQLKDKEQTANWIVMWREYAITNTNSKFIANKERKKEQTFILCYLMECPHA